MALDDADKAAIAEMIKISLGEFGKTVVTADALGKTLEQTLAKHAEAERKALDEKLEKLKGGDPDPEKDKGGKEKSDGDPVLLGKLREMEQRLEDEKKAREQAEAQRKDAALDGAARAALAKAGIPADRAAHAMAFLRAQRVGEHPLIGHDDKGAPVFRVDKGTYVDTLSLEDGLKGWAESTDGKLYMPPKGTQGDGSGNGGRSGGDGKATTSLKELGSTIFGML